jgi:large subunit ribosomal protein L25
MSLVIKSATRDALGKNASRRIRRTGLVPAVLYGEGVESVSLTLDKKDIIRILKSETGENTLFKLALEGGEKDAMIKAVQIDPTTDEILHADLIRIAMDKILRVMVPLEVTGDAYGVKTEGGFVDFMTREIEVECLPALIPERLVVDITPLRLHQSLKVGEIPLPEGVKLISEPATVAVLIQVPHEEKVEAKPEEEAAEEAAAPAAAVAAAAEPEVIKKERKKEEGEEK